MEIPLGACRMMARIKATRPAICYRNHHLRWHNIGMDDIRESFSEIKKRIKHRITGKSRKADEGQASGGGVGVGNVEPSGSVPPQAVTSDDSE